MSHKCHNTIKVLLGKIKLIPQITHMSYGIHRHLAPSPECNFKHCVSEEPEMVWAEDFVCVCVCV